MESIEDVQWSTRNLIEVDWMINDTTDNRVIKFSLWRDMDDYHDLEVRRGVFVFVNIFFKVKYIGKADEGRMVLEIAEAIKSGKSEDVALIKVLYTSTEEKSQSLEQDLIKKYNPANNFI